MRLETVVHDGLRRRLKCIGIPVNAVASMSLTP